MTRLDVTLLGRFAVAVDGRPLEVGAWRYRPAADLVKLLALAPGHRLPAEVVVEARWPETTTERGRGNLRKAVHYARRALGTAAGIVTEGGIVALWPTATVSVDAARFEAATRAALATKDPSIAAEAADLYGGELLPDDRYAPWVEAHRERLRFLALAVLKLARRWSAALGLDPLDEEAHRGAMLEDLAAGRRRAVIRRFEQLRHRLRDEPAVSPDPETLAVYEQALASRRPDPPTPAQRARTLLAWGLVHWERQDLEEAERTAREARALAVDAGLGAEVGEASALIVLVSQARGAWRSFFGEELLASVRETPELAPFVLDANLCLTQFCLYLPDALDEVRRFSSGLADAAARGSEAARGLAVLLEGEVALAAGALGSAQAILASASPWAASSGGAGPLILERLSASATWAGRRWRARRLLPRALRIARANPLAGRLVVRVHATRLESAATEHQAVSIVRSAEVELRTLALCRPCSIAYRTAAARHLAAAGLLDEAQRQLAEAERIATLWPGGYWAAAVGEAAAALAAADGQARDAARGFEAAARGFEAAGFRLEARRARASAAVPEGPPRSSLGPTIGNGPGTPRSR